MKAADRSSWVTSRRSPAWAVVMAPLAMVSILAGLSLGATSAGATAYVRVTGEGSSWSAGAILQWTSDVQAYGAKIDYAPFGSTTGRQDYLKGLTDFAASDIPFQTNPTDGSPPEHPAAGSYAYMPITAGGTVFMYNLKINGQRVTNLRLSGSNIAKIFTGTINNWDDPALAVDNPGLKLPSQAIVPVVRSDGSGTSYELSEWMISQYPSIWNAYCARVGRTGECGPTSFYPTVPGMIAQSGDQQVSGYVSQSYANGAIGYVNNYYAITTDFPTVKMLNAAGYYTEPTAQNVAVSLLKDQVDTTDVNNPALYLTQKLDGVYTDPDPRTYPLSSYGYLILPTKVTPTGSFTTAKGSTLAFFANYAMCQGQQEVSLLGYSPMPINLVEAGFAQIAKIPGAVALNTDIRKCGNPTFSSNGTNLLATTAPYPQACDKQGATQCTTGTGGAAAIATPVSSGSRGAGTTNGSTGSTGRTGSTGSTGGSGSQGSTVTGASGTGTGSASSSTNPPCDPTTGACGSSSGGGSAGSDPTASTATLAVATGWSTTQTLLVLIGLVLLAIILIPGLFWRRMDRRRD